MGKYHISGISGITSRVPEWLYTIWCCLLPPQHQLLSPRQHYVLNTVWTMSKYLEHLNITWEEGV